MRNKLVFRAGQRYKIRSEMVKVQRTATQPGSDGIPHEVILSAKELAFFITSEAGEKCFMDSRCIGEGILIEGEKTVTDTSIFTPNGLNTYLTKYKVVPDFSLQQLADSFEIPTAPDAASVNPEAYRRNLDFLDEIERRIVEASSGRSTPQVSEEKMNQFRFRQFQRRDYARAALYDGIIFAHDTGLGKSIAAIAWPLLKVGIHKDDPAGFTPAKPVLIIAPTGLHEQLRDEWRGIFGIEVTELDSQETFLELSPLRPGWYLSSFTEIASNKVLSLPEVPKGIMDTAEVSKLMEFYGVTLADAKAHVLKDGNTQAQASLVDKAVDLCLCKYELFRKNVGNEMNGFKCVYSPSLADYVRHAFACVVIDESVHIKSEDSLIGIGCRSLEPKYRMLLTSTPIKNRLGDIFWLAWWATGSRQQAHARWPYSSGDGELRLFQQKYLVTKRDLTKERAEAAEKGNDGYNPYASKRKGTPTAAACCVPSLWKLFAPIVLRRRKADIGEEIVPKIRHNISVPMGKEQAEVYRYHLESVYLDRNGNECLLAKLQALRSCAAAPHSKLLEDQVPSGKFRSDIDYIPKMAAALAVVLECLNRGEQVIIGAPYLDPLDSISRRLAEAGVPHDVLDGRTTPAKRGLASKSFKRGLDGGANPVLLCGMGSMSEGHNWPLANNVIFVQFDWAWDNFKQFTDRVHRLTSAKPVNMYSITCAGSIDLRLDALLEEKGSSQELVLDGKLIGENTEEVDLNELMKAAISEFSQRKVLDEAECEREWPALRVKLRSAWANIENGKPPVHTNGESRLTSVINTIRTPVRTLAPYPIKL